MPNTFKLEWDKTGERRAEAGVSRGVLYVMSAGAYQDGVAWNGLTGVDTNPDGGDVNDIWADNIKYISYQTPENHKGTIKCYMFPDEFLPCIGLATPAAGLSFAGQKHVMFGYCYRTEIMSDDEEEKGYELHLIYGCKASAVSRSHSTKNENVDPEEISIDYSSTPASVTAANGVSQVSEIIVSSLTADSTKLAALETALYGTAGANGTEGRLPSPDEVYALIA